MNTARMEDLGHPEGGGEGDKSDTSPAASDADTTSCSTGSPQSGRARSGAMLLLGTSTEVFLPFVRSVALAHLIAPHEFGLAIALAVSMGFIELIADIGIGNSAMRQSALASEKETLPTLHSIMLIRGAVMGTLLFIGGGQFAQVFGAPEAGWSFSALGVAVFVRSFANLEIKEKIRHFVYGPDAAATASNQVMWTALTVGTAVILQDYRCMLVGLFAGAISYVLTSHLLSTQRFRLGWSPEVAREAWIYGAPLIPNGIALALSSMGDRFLIGSLLGLGHLATYNVVATAAFMPRGVVIRLLMAVAVPLFLRNGREGAAKARIYEYWGILLTAVGSFYALGFLCFGGVFIGLVFGSSYEPSQLLTSLFATSAFFKFLVILATPTALAFGQTGFILATSIAAGLAVFSAAAAVLGAPTLEAFMMGLVAGEALALIWIIWKTLVIYPFMPRLTWFLVLIPPLLLGAVHLFLAESEHSGLLVRIAAFLVAAAALVVLFAGAALAAKLPFVPPFLRSWRSTESSSPEPVILASAPDQA